MFLSTSKKIRNRLVLFTCICSADKKVVRRGPTQFFFYADEWGEDPSTIRREGLAIIGPIMTLYIGCWLGSFVIFQGTQTSIAKESYSFVIFLGVGWFGRTPPPASGSAHGYTVFNLMSTLCAFLSSSKVYATCRSRSAGFLMHTFSSKR